MDWIPVCDGTNWYRVFDDGSYEIIEDEKGGPDKSRPE
jgi:hypothetical protein